MPMVRLPNGIHGLLHYLLQVPAMTDDYDRVAAEVLPCMLIEAEVAGGDCEEWCCQPPCPHCASRKAVAAAYRKLGEERAVLPIKADAYNLTVTVAMMRAVQPDTYDLVAREFCPEACANLRVSAGIDSLHTETCRAPIIASRYATLAEERDAKWRRLLHGERYGDKLAVLRRELGLER